MLAPVHARQHLEEIELLAAGDLLEERVARDGIAHCLLVLDVEGTRSEREDISRSHQRLTAACIVSIKEFETRVLHRVPRDVAAIRLPLHPRRAPTVHVDDDLDAGVDADPIGMGQHVASESMNDEHLWREGVRRYEIGEKLDGSVHVAGVERSKECFDETSSLVSERIPLTWGESQARPGQA